MYRSERGVPMWFPGYEHGGYREAFRIPDPGYDDSLHATPGSQVPGSQAPGSSEWHSTRFRDAWVRAIAPLRKLCDAGLLMQEGEKEEDTTQQPARRLSVPSNAELRDGESLSVRACH